MEGKCNSFPSYKGGLKLIEKLLKKHAKNFVADKQDGKLEGIHYHQNGSIYLTDACTLLAFHDVHTDEQYTVHYKTGKKMDINYPDVTRLLKTDYDDSITINLQDIKKYIELIKVANEIDWFGDLINDSGELTFLVKNKSGEQFSLKLNERTVKNDYTIKVHSLSVMYFYNMLQFFKDAQVNEITYSFKENKFFPLSFRSGNYEILILPVKRG